VKTSQIASGKSKYKLAHLHMCYMTWMLYSKELM
jgi:hypothetical protein